MTQAQRNKMESDKKLAFIAKTYAAVLNGIPETTKAARKHTQIRLTHQGYNRYIRFHLYGKDMNIQIFGDGNVAIELNEVMHGEYKEQLFEYTAEVERQDAFLAEFEEVISGLIPVFLDHGVTDFHTYMDYVGATDNVVAAYRQMMQEWCRNKNADPSKKAARETAR